VSLQGTRDGFGTEIGSIVEFKQFLYERLGSKEEDAEEPEPQIAQIDADGTD